MGNRQFLPGQAVGEGHADRCGTQAGEHIPVYRLAQGIDAHFARGGHAHGTIEARQAHRAVRHQGVAGLAHCILLQHQAQVAIDEGNAVGGVAEVARDMGRANQDALALHHVDAGGEHLHLVHAGAGQRPLEADVEGPGQA